jgi:predicted DNA-binding transcriptional regulator
MGEDLVAAVFFRGLIRRSILDRKWLENHVDRLLAAHQA